MCSTLCDPMDCSTPGFPVLQHLPELFKLMFVELVMPLNHLILCHPLFLLSSIFPSIRVFSNEWALCIDGQCIGASASSSVLSMNIQCRFGFTGFISLQSKGLSSVSSNNTVQKHQFFSTLPSLWLNSRLHTRPLEKP